METYRSSEIPGTYGNIGNSIKSPANLIFYQWTLIPPFKITVNYNNHTLEPPMSYIENFQNRYKYSFGRPINEDFEYSVLSSFLSGLGYFSGPILQSGPTGNNYSSLGNLLSFTPSRLFFPRGFLWDEGFHLLVASLWDIDLYRNITLSWLNTMNDYGWIPREQIRGPRAESKVPEAFLVQDASIANPPTLLLPVISLLQSYKYYSPEQGCDSLIDFFAEIYPKLNL